jgi:hypothetical protein
MTSKRSHLAAPMVMRDIPEYRSPIDGRMITTRGARREDLKRNNCVEVDPPKHKVVRSEKYARFIGAEVDKNYRRKPAFKE